MVDTTIGNANTENSSYGSVGAFNGLFPQDVANQAMAMANELYPQLPEADPWEAAFQFFTEMGRQSSQPGATLLGSAVGSMQAPMDYLNAKKKEKAESDRARMQATLSLGTTLKGKDSKGYINVNVDGKPTVMTSTEITAAKAAGRIVVPYEKPTTSSGGNTTVGVDPDNLPALRILLNLPNLNADSNNNIIIPNSDVSTATAEGLIIPKKTVPKEGVEKYLQQDRVMYMTEDEAKTKLKLFGVEEGDAEFADLLSLITTDDDDLIGKPVIQADAYLSFYVPRAGEDSEFNVITRTPGGSAVPAEVILRNEELKKLVPIVFKQRQVMNSLLPTLDSAMTVLLQNPDITGSFQNITMDARNFLSSTFGFSDSELEDQKFLDALSNKLAPQMRPVGSGSTSDMEFRAYKSAILALTNPAKTNYLTLYSLSKTTKSASTELELRKKLLSQNKSEEYIQNKIAELDKGIYEKFEEPSPDMSLQDFILARDAWKNNLPIGSVILNKNSSGKKIYPNAGTFIIKGWRGLEE